MQGPDNLHSQLDFDLSDTSDEEGGEQEEVAESVASKRYRSKSPASSCSSRKNKKRHVDLSEFDMLKMALDKNSQMKLS